MDAQRKVRDWSRERKGETSEVSRILSRPGGERGRTIKGALLLLSSVLPLFCLQSPPFRATLLYLNAWNRLWKLQTRRVYERILRRYSAVQVKVAARTVQSTIAQVINAQVQRIQVNESTINICSETVTKTAKVLLVLCFVTTLCGRIVQQQDRTMRWARSNQHRVSATY